MTASPTFEKITELKKLAYETIQDVCLEGEKTHTPGSWMEEGDLHHLGRGVDHVANYSAAIDGGRPLSREDLRIELTHNLCRAAMALWSFDNGVLGSFGNEGKGQ